MGGKMKSLHWIFPLSFSLNCNKLIDSLPSITFEIIFENNTTLKYKRREQQRTNKGLKDTATGMLTLGVKINEQLSAIICSQN